MQSKTHAAAKRIGRGCLFLSLLVLPLLPLAAAQEEGIGFFSPTIDNTTLAGHAGAILSYPLFADIGDASDGNVNVRFYYADNPNNQEDLAPPTTVYVKPGDGEWGGAKPAWCASTVAAGGTDGWCRVGGTMGLDGHFGKDAGTQPIQLAADGPDTVVETATGTRDGVYRTLLVVALPNVHGEHASYLALEVMPPSAGAGPATPGATAGVTPSITFRKLLSIQGVQTQRLSPDFPFVAHGQTVAFAVRITGSRPIATVETILDGATLSMTRQGGPRDYRTSTFVGAGSHAYVFRATFSDAYTIESESFVLDVETHSPLLSGAAVTPSNGAAGTTVFQYSVVYRDSLGHAPASSQLFIDGTVAGSMTSGSTEYAEGALYSYSTPLGGGSHSYFFRFVCDAGFETRFPATGSLSGPTTTGGESMGGASGASGGAATPAPLGLAGVAAVDVTRTSARIQWTVSGPVDARSFVEYGPTNTYGSVSDIQVGPGAHGIALTGLEAGQTYHFRVVADHPSLAGVASQDRSFVANHQVQVQILDAAPNTATSIRVSWSVTGATDVTSHIEWGRAATLGQRTTSQAGPGLKSDVLTGLALGETIHFRVVVRDPFGPTASTEVRTQALRLDLAILDVADSFLRADARLVTWRVRGFEDVQSRVEWDEGAFLDERTANVAGPGPHRAELAPLKQGTTYQYRVVAVASDGTRAESPLKTFQVGTVGVAPAVANVVATGTPGLVRVSVNVVGEPGAVSHVEYGADATYGRRTQSRTGTGAIEFLIADLVDAGTYHFRIIVTNPDGRTADSGDRTVAVDTPGTQKETGSRLTAPLPSKIPVNKGLFVSLRLPDGTVAAHVDMLDLSTGRLIERIALQNVVDPATGETFWTGSGTAGAKGQFALIATHQAPDGSSRSEALGTVQVGDEPAGLSAGLLVFCLVVVGAVVALVFFLHGRNPKPSQPAPVLGRVVPPSGAPARGPTPRRALVRGTQRRSA